MIKKRLTSRQPTWIKNEDRRMLKRTFHSSEIKLNFIHDGNYSKISNRNHCCKCYLK